MTIGRKLVLGFATLLFLMAVVAAISFSSFDTMKVIFGKAVEFEKEGAAKSLVEVAYAALAEQHALEAAGKITRADAQRNAINTIKSMRYGDGGYFWINDTRPSMVMHPIIPELDGKDLSDYKDPTGKRMFVEFTEMARTHGAGFVPYMWPKSSNTKPVRKLSFVKGFEPWGWIIGTGVYLDDVNAAAAQTWAMEIRKNKVTAVAVLITALFIGIVALLMIRQISAKLRQIVGELSRGAEQVAGIASQVSSTSQVLAQESSEQAASLEETSSSTEEINSMTRKNADNSKDSAKLMAEMAQRVEEGNRKLNDMVASMKEINIASEKISKIIKNIDGIAFQTNILALNAAVEAARAGEAGLGFAVVADEVRNLAQRSAQAAKDTSGLIEDSVVKSQEGGRRLDEVAKAIAGITEDAARVNVLVDEVQVGSQEQARGLEQISKAISQMEQVTQKTAANAEQSAAAGQELGAQSETLRSIVSGLAALVGATAGETTAQPTSK